MYNIEAMLQKAIVATKNNHPDSDMGLTISSAIAEYINNRSNNNLELDNLKTFCMYFSKKNYSTNEEIRNPLMTSFFQIQRDVAIYIFKLLYSFSIKEISKEPTDEKYAASLLRYIDSFAKLKSTFDSIDIENEIAKNSIYRNTVLLKDVLDNSKPILEQYVNNVLLEAEKTINLRNVVISNIEDLSSFSLKESLDYNYVYGNLEINMSTRKGYTYIPKKEGVVKDQEDAILSISRDGCSLNVVADGAGGHEMGQIASSMVIDGLKNWFNSLDLSKYNTVIDDKNTEITTKQAESERYIHSLLEDNAALTLEIEKHLEENAKIILANETLKKEFDKLKVEENNYAVINLSDSERDLLAKILALEAGDQPDCGQRAVVEVVFNRVLTGWASTVEGVLLQKGQFSTVKYLDHPYQTPDEKEYANIDYVLSHGSTILPTDYVFFATYKANGKDFIHIEDHYFGRK